jgi:hypothetical protein
MVVPYSTSLSASTINLCIGELPQYTLLTDGLSDHCFSNSIHKLKRGKMKGCFKLGEKEYCIYVPIFYRVPKWWPIPPEEVIIDTPIDFGGPPPTPWLEGTDIKREVVDDLSVLAGIDVLTEAIYAVTK